MPGRNGIAFQSDWVPGKGFVAGNSYPDYLQVSSRPYAPTPDAYRAGKEVELLPGFETATATDELLVEIQAGSGVLSNDYPGGQGSNDMYGYYRYGFNGQERETDLSLSHTSSEHWMYDGRLGRRWNVDPQTQKMPSFSPYSVALNNPNVYSDEDGQMPWIKWLVDIGAGMATDYFIQVVANLVINDMTLSDALVKVSVWQILRSGGENLIKNKHYAAIASGSGDAIEYLSTTENPTLEGASQRFVLGAGSSYIGDWIAKYGIDKVAKGLSKLGMPTNMLASMLNSTFGGALNGLQMQVKVKRFPLIKGSWVSQKAKEYQKKFSGNADLSFEVNGVSFDAVKDGVLIDAKFGHGSSIFDDAFEVKNTNRADKIIEQANRQLRAVGDSGTKIEWHISTEKGAEGIRKLFLDNNINIDVKFTPSG